MKNTDRQFPLACLSSHPHPTLLVDQVDHLLPVHHLVVGSVNDLTPLKISNTAESTVIYVTEGWGGRQDVNIDVRTPKFFS